MVSIYKRSKFWTSLPFFILLMTFGSIVTMADHADDFKALFDQTQQGSVFYLDNGMEIILVENHANPMITAFTIVKTGSRNEDAVTNGTAHFLEHLLFNGTKTRTQKQLYDEMDFYGGYNNAHTGPDYTNYMVLMPKEFIAQGMDIQADMLFNSTLPEDKFEKERGIVTEEIGRSADRPTYQVQNHFLRTFFAGTPYERLVLGTVFYHSTSPARAGLGILSDVVRAEQHDADGYRRFFNTRDGRASQGKVRWLSDGSTAPCPNDSIDGSEKPANHLGKWHGQIPQ